MKKSFLYLVAIFFTTIITPEIITGQNQGQLNFRQPDKNCPDLPIVYQGRQVMTYCENMPYFEGGAEARDKYFSDSANWPSVSKKEKFQETILAKVLIDTNGKVFYVCIMNRLYPDKFTDIEKEAIRLIEHMPAWIPAEDKGKKVPFEFNMPIRPNITKYKW